MPSLAEKPTRQSRYGECSKMRRVFAAAAYGSRAGELFGETWRNEAACGALIGRQCLHPLRVAAVMVKPVSGME